MWTGRRITVSTSRARHKKRRDEMIDLDEIAHLREALRREQRRVFGQELRVVRPWPVDVRAREHDHLRHAVRLAVLEQLRRAGDVPRVQLGRPRARVVHHAEMDQRVDIAGAEHVARALAAQVDLVMLDVLGPPGHRSPIEADDPPTEIVMQAARDQASETPRDAGDHDLARSRHRAFGGRRRLTRRHACARQPEMHQRLDAVRTVLI